MKAARLDWFELLGQKRCTNCSTTLKPSERGPRRAFCPECTSKLPDNLSLHLDRALRSRWYVAWWRLGCQVLRNTPIEIPASIRLDRTRSAA